MAAAESSDTAAAKAEEKPSPPEEKQPRPWVKPALACLGVVLVAAGAGFGIGYLTRSDDSGPDLTADEAFAQARDQTEQEVSRDMARRGFIAGKRNGRSHGIIAGGMAAESAVTIRIRQLRASAAQNAAASAQAELAGMSGGAPAVPTPDLGE